MILNGTPEWTHITRDGLKACIVTDKMGGDYPVLVLVESKFGDEEFESAHYAADLLFYSDGRTSDRDLKPYNPLEDVKVDTPIWVKRDGSWVHRHFAYTKGGMVYAWVDGKTSFTETIANPWPHYSLTDPTNEL